MLLIGGLFFLVLFGYAVLSRALDVASITPQLVVLGAGLAFGVIAREAIPATLDIEVLRVAGEIALILCLFVDAARIDIGALRGGAMLPMRLLVVGLPLTVLAGAATALLVVPGATPIEAVLVALLVAPTDAALGAVVVNSERVPVRIRQALNVESGLNDGLVTPLVLVAVALLAAGTASPDRWIVDAIRQIVVGAAVGIGVGAGAAVVLRIAQRRGTIQPEARWVIAPAIAIVAWFAAHGLYGNAFVAAFVAGIACTAVLGSVTKGAFDVGEAGGELLGLLVFFLVGILLPTLGPFEPEVVIFAVLALTVVRMVPVAIALVGTRLTPATVAFMGWFGPRGLASVVLAIITIEAAEAPGVLSPWVVTSVMVTIAFSVFAHGLSAGPGVRAYGRRVAALDATAAELQQAPMLRTRGRILAVDGGQATDLIPPNG